MNMLNHFLFQIPGPVFLIYYTIYTIALFIAYKGLFLWFSNQRHSESFVKPQLNGIEMVVLNNMGSKLNVLKAVITSLWYKKVLVLQEDGTMKLRPEANNQHLSRLEQMVASFFKEPQSLKKVLIQKKWVKQFSNDISEIYESLRAKQMLKSLPQNRSEIIVYLITFFLLMFPAILKFRLGLINNKPVVFLMTLFIIYFIIFLFFYPTKKTKYAKNVVKEYQEKYKNVKADLSKPHAYDNGMDPLLYAGIFGVGALFLFPEFGALNSAFPIESSSSGCSSCSTSSGCSSCGGGSGCGGCGGGD